MERTRVPVWRRVGTTRAAAAVFLVAAAIGLLTAPHARAQSRADALIGCFAGTPGGQVWVRIDRQGGKLGFTPSRGQREALVPATGEDEREVAEELGLDRFPGVTIVAGQSDVPRMTTFVVLSSPLSWDGQRTQFVFFDYDFGAEPMFKVNCS